MMDDQNKMCLVAWYSSRVVASLFLLLSFFLLYVDMIVIVYIARFISPSKTFISTTKLPAGFVRFVLQHTSASATMFFFSCVCRESCAIISNVRSDTTMRLTVIGFPSTWANLACIPSCQLMDVHHIYIQRYAQWRWLTCALVLANGDNNMI